MLNQLGANLWSLTVLAVVALGCYAAGRPFAERLVPAEDSRFDRTVWSVAIGFILWGTVLAWLGLCGLLHPAALQAVSAIAALWGGWLAVRDWRQRNSAAPQQRRSSGDVSPPPRWIKTSLQVLAAVALLGALVAALAPPTAGDALCYHLQLPKTYLQQGSLVHLPDCERSTFPLLVEMGFLWALALDGPVAANLVHWGLGLLLVASTVTLAAPLVGRSWAHVAACVVALVPGISNEMTAPLNDVGLAALATLALAAWLRLALFDGGKRFAVLAGLAAGGALSVKFNAVLLVPAVAAVWVVQLWRQREDWRPAVGRIAIVAGLALAVSCIWYGRAAWQRGNPIYPFLNEQIAGEPPLRPAHDKRPLGIGLGLIAAPWEMTMHPDRFGGRGHQLGAVFLMFLPGLAVCRRLRGLGLLLAVAGGYTLACLCLRQNVRFLFPLVPLLACGVVWVMSELRQFAAPVRSLAVIALTGLMLLNAAIAVRRCRQELPVALGWQSREDYLETHEPTYGLTRQVNRQLGRGCRILSQEQRAFYFQPPLALEAHFRSRTAYDAPQSGWLPRVQAEGFTHLLLAESHGGGMTYDSTLRQLAEPWIDAQKMRVVAEHRHRDAEGNQRYYRLVELPDTGRRKR